MTVGKYSGEEVVEKEAAQDEVAERRKVMGQHLRSDWWSPMEWGATQEKK